MNAYTGQRTNKKKKNISLEDRISKAQNVRYQLERHLKTISEILPKNETLPLWIAYLRQIKHGLNAIDAQFSIELYKDLSDDEQTTLEGAES